MKNKLEVAVNLLLGLAAITVLYGYVGGSRSTNSKASSEELDAEDWKFASSESRSTIGNASAHHRLVIFTEADLLYEKQDSIGLITMSEFAARVGSSDVPAFEQCVASKPAAISAHSSFGEKLGITATPTVLLDGRRLSGPPTDELLDRIYGATAK